MKLKTTYVPVEGFFPCLGILHAYAQVLERQLFQSRSTAFVILKDRLD